MVKIEKETIPHPGASSFLFCLELDILSLKEVQSRVKGSCKTICM